MVIERLSKKHKTDKEEAQIGLLHGLKKFFVFLCQRKVTKLIEKLEIITLNLLHSLQFK